MKYIFIFIFFLGASISEAKTHFKLNVVFNSETAKTFILTDGLFKVPLINSKHKCVVGEISQNKDIASRSIVCRGSSSTPKHSAVFRCPTKLKEDWDLGGMILGDADGIWRMNLSCFYAGK